jgi:peptidoglycan-associated lipoprotein
MGPAPGELINNTFTQGGNTMQQTAKTLMVCIFIAALMGSVACSKKNAPVATMDPSAELQDADLGAGEFRSPADIDPALAAIFQNILFNYDEFALTPQARATLDGIATWMKSNPAKLVLVEGHCDERGTNEYNLALGDRRANSAKTYLTQLGIDGARIYTISYGEERPVAMGSSEAAWVKNRRGEFKIK